MTYLFLDLFLDEEIAYVMDKALDNYKLEHGYPSDHGYPSRVTVKGLEARKEKSP